MQKPWPTIELLRGALNRWQEDSPVDWAWCIDKKTPQEWQLSCDATRYKCPVKLVAKLQEGEPVGWIVTVFITKHSHGQADDGTATGDALDSILDRYRPPEPEPTLPSPDVSPPQAIKCAIESSGLRQPTKRPLDIGVEVFEVAEEEEVRQALSPPRKRRKQGATAERPIEIIDSEGPDSDFEIVTTGSKQPPKVKTPAKESKPRQQSEESLPKASSPSQEPPRPTAVVKQAFVSAHEAAKGLEKAGKTSGELVDEEPLNETQYSAGRTSYPGNHIQLIDKWSDSVVGPRDPPPEASVMSRKASKTAFRDAASASHGVKELRGSSLDAEKEEEIPRDTSRPVSISQVVCGAEKVSGLEMEVDELNEDEERVEFVPKGRQGAVKYTEREDAWLCDMIVEHWRLHGSTIAKLLRHIAALETAQPKRDPESYRRRWKYRRISFRQRMLALAGKMSQQESSDMADWLQSSFRDGAELGSSETPHSLAADDDGSAMPATYNNSNRSFMFHRPRQPAETAHLPAHETSVSLRTGLEGLTTHLDGVLLPDELEGLPALLQLAGTDDFEHLKGLTRNEFSDFLMENDVFPTTARRMAAHFEAGSVEAFLSRLHPGLGPLAREVFPECVKPSDLKTKSVSELTNACEKDLTKCTQLQRLLLVNRLGAVRRFL